MEQENLSGSETSTNEEELDSVTEKDSALKPVEEAEKDCRRKVSWLRLASACMNAMVKKVVKWIPCIRK